MENSQSSDPYPDVPSTNDFTNKGSFGNAFKEAHGRAGKGHTFTWNGNMYTTDTADNGDYRR